MAYTVTPYRFTPPGPSFELTNTEKAAWSKIWESTANLDDYPDRHEVIGLKFYIDHKMYDGHGTHWNAKYYNRATNKLLFESDHDIPDPSTAGWTYWNWYRLFSWIGHCDWEIDSPMEIQVNVNITSNIMPPASYLFYFTVTTSKVHTLTVIPQPGICRVELLDKNGHVVFNELIPPYSSAVIKDLPEMLYTLKVSQNGYNDHIKVFTLTEDTTFRITLTASTVWDWIVGFVIDGIEGLLGIQKGTLITMLGNVWEIMTNFFGAIYDFFSDVIGSIVDVVKDNIGSVFDWVTDQFTGFVDWLADIGGDLAGFISDSVAASVDFLTDKLSDFFDWVKDLPGSIADYIVDVVSGFADWSQDQLGSIWEGIQTWFAGAISGFVEAFFGGVNTGIEQAKGSPLHSDEPVRNPVLKGLQKVVREHRKKYNRDEITGENKYGRV